MGYGNPCRGPRLVPFGAARTSRDVLPNGHPAFRVTQRFLDWDIFFGGRHGAIDIGNYWCGDEILAMESGKVRNRSDRYGALIVEITHRNGEVTGYGHLSRFAVSDGANVVRGQVIGWVGSTGLGDVCHCHVYVRTPTGVLVDPWPLLDQNQLPDTSTTVYVKFNPGVNGVNLRRAPDARVNNVYSIAYADADPRPNGIIRVSDGKWLGNTGARRTSYGTVKGPDGKFYYRLKLKGTSLYQYVNTMFMHRI